MSEFLKPAPQEAWQQETPFITPQTLMADNRSEEAEKGRFAWEEARRQGSLFAIEACADSRTKIPNLEETVLIRSIASAGPVEPYTTLINSRGVGQGIILTHFDGNRAEKGKRPPGCGGLGAKETQLASGATNATEGVSHYVENQIATADTLIQACLTASAMSEQTDKPILAATQDHLDGTIYPVALYWNQGRARISAIPESLLYKYNEAEIYENGIPHLEDSEIPDWPRRFLRANRLHVQKLYDLYPNLRQKEATQNPPLAVLTTDIRPFALRYPNLQEPGSFFSLSIPRLKDGISSTIHIPKEELATSLNQMGYPVTNFSRLNTIFIETRNFDKSKAVAEELVQKPWMRPWLQDGGHQILIGETQAGVATRIEVFKI